MVPCSRSPAAVWSIEPTVGVLGDYNTNPELLASSYSAQLNGALLLDAPTAYNADAFKFTVLPSFRFSESNNYNAVDSSYAHLTAKSEFDTELSTLGISAGVLRDSSLYQNYLLNGSSGVERNTFISDVNWDRHLTERLEFDLDAAWQEVRYGTPPTGGTLTDYKYASLAPTVYWINSERGKFNATLSAGLYNSTDGSTQSKSLNLQVGYTHQLHELWSWSVAGGYSRALNRVDYTEEVIVETPQGPAIEFVPLTQKSGQNGSVYSMSVTRQTTRLTMTASASRQLIPTGLAYLGSQDAFSVSANYTLTPRWSLSATAQQTINENPAVPHVSGAYHATINVITAQAVWRWTEYWTMTVAATRVFEDIASSDLNVYSNGVSVQFSRHFKRTTW